MNYQDYVKKLREFEEYMQKRDPFFRNIKRMINGVYCVSELEKQWLIWQ